VPLVFRWLRLLPSRSSPRLWWACGDFDAAAYRCISIEGGCLRSLATAPFGAFAGFSVFTCGIFLSSCGILVAFCGTLVDFRTCLVVPLNVLDC
jgi:hypothetical protein